MKKFVFKAALNLTAVILLCVMLFSCAWAGAADQNWYIEHAELLRDDLYEIISSEGFGQYFSTSEDIASQIDAWKTGMEEEPISTSAYDMPSFEMLLTMMGGIESMPELPEPLMKRFSRGLGNTLITTLNGQQGTIFLAASSMATFSEGYIMPEDFKPCIIIYEYEDFCVCVNFSESGEETIQASVHICTDQLVEMLNVLP